MNYMQLESEVDGLFRIARQSQETSFSEPGSSMGLGTKGLCGSTEERLRRISTVNEELFKSG